MSKVSDMQIKLEREERQLSDELLDHVSLFIFELTKSLTDLNDSIEKSVKKSLPSKEEASDLEDLPM